MQDCVIFLWEREGFNAEGSLNRRTELKVQCEVAEVSFLDELKRLFVDVYKMGGQVAHMSI